MEAKTLIIMLLVFSAVITGFNIFTADEISNYSQNIDDLSTLSTADNITAQVKVMDDTFNAKVTGTILDIPISAITGGMEFLKLVSLSLFGFWDPFINGAALSTYLHLPIWFIGIIFTIFVVIAIFAVYHAIKWGY